MGLTFYERGPGPAGYALPPLIGRTNHAPTHRINPEYGFGLKLPAINRGLGPGPAAYALRKGLKAKGTWETGPEYTMRTKTSLHWKDLSPGPANYPPPCIDCIRHRAPGYTMGTRTGSAYRTILSPGPANYALGPMIGPYIPTKLAAAECTLKGGIRVSGPKDQSPGPIYDVGPPEIVKKNPPRYSMRVKWPQRFSQNCECSPASYDVTTANVHPAKPAWKFGIRYNDFTGRFTTDCDRSKYEPLD